MLLVLCSLGSVAALEQPSPPGGAPDPRPGPFRPDGYVRVSDGNTFETLIDGRRVLVGVIGIDVPPYGTPCGDAAADRLRELARGGLLLEDDPSLVLDARKRRMYRVTTTDGRLVAELLVAAGLARADGRGADAAALAATEARARQERAGCVWGGPLPAPAEGAAGARVADAAVRDAAVPSGFADEVVASGLTLPTGFAFLPDGRILVTEKGGRVQLVASGGGPPRTVLDLRSITNSYHDRGLLGIAVDPAFPSNRSFYLYYVYEHNSAVPWGPKTGRIVRYILDANDTASPASGVIILGSYVGDGCPVPPNDADCLPAEGISHQGGTLRFAPDGALFVSTGDAASFTAVDDLALRAQDLNSLAGKILRVTPGGQGLPSNPFAQGAPTTAIRSKVWARGFRNPFRMTLRPGTAMPYVGDVGWTSWEEIDLAPAGANLGWPCYEGSGVQLGYQEKPVCRALYADGASAVRGPLIAWDHALGTASALSGTFYTGTAFPPTYQGAFVYADYALGWIKSVRVDANDRLVGAPVDFASGLPGPVAVEMGPDGALYYAVIASGELRRIRYVGTYTPIQCPAGQFRAEYYGSFNETLSGAPAFQQCEAAIDYDWGYGSPGGGLFEDHFSIRWTGRFSFGADIYEFQTISDDGVRLWVDGELLIDDWRGGAANLVTAQKWLAAGEHAVVVEYYDDVSNAEIRVSWQGQSPNRPPVPTIAAPTAGLRFKVGDVVQVQGSASDPEDGPLPADRLRWDVTLQHCPGFGGACHAHPFTSFGGASGQLLVPDHGDGLYFEITLTATDLGGLSGRTTVRIDPKQIQLTLATEPPGGTVIYDGTAFPSPYTVTTVAGSRHSISVQLAAGQEFVRWSQGGPRQQDVVVGETDVTYTATLGPATTACAPRPRVAIATTPLGGGRLQVTVAPTSNPGFEAPPIRAIRFEESRQAEIEAAGLPRSAAPFSIAYPEGTTQATFVVQRTGAGAVHVGFTVTDACGGWPTFVGGGPGAF